MTFWLGVGIVAASAFLAVIWALCAMAGDR